MKRLNLVIHNSTGLHARPAKTLVNLAKQFQSKISVQHGEKEVNAKSMIGILKLGVKKSGEIVVLIDGEDEDEAAEQIETAVATGLGEGIESHPVESDSVKESTHSTPTHSVKPQDENQLRGVGASPGIAIGPLFQLRRQPVEAFEERPFQGREQEEEAFQKAHHKATLAIEEMRQKAATTLTAEEAEIFSAHLEILNDPELLEGVKKGIDQKQSALAAWQSLIQEQVKLLSGLADPLLAARAADVRDVGQQVATHLSSNGRQSTVPLPERPYILVADDLTPSETIALDKNLVLGICTASGGPTAHAAILARALKLPAIVAVGEKVLALSNDTNVILNGATGALAINPSAEQLAEAKSAQKQQQDKQKADEARASETAVTQDGHHVEVVANIGAPAEAAQAYEKGAEGVGLLRTEFLFLEKEQPPTEDEQFAIYRQIAEAMHHQPVIIRTLDIGGDKPVPYINVGEEANPFLGERGIRLCLNQPELFKTQLRAIVRASDYGKLLIMFPMISDVRELIEARRLVEEEVQAQGADPIEIGIMVEVPSAALMVDQMAPHLDFVSIGTNDLTQYTLAVDRQHPSLAYLSDGLHPAVLRLIDLTVKAAHKAGKWVGVCGELAADPQAAPILVGLGVDELSVNMNAIASLKAQIRTLMLPEAIELAQRALACATAQAVRELR